MGFRGPYPATSDITTGPAPGTRSGGTRRPLTGNPTPRRALDPAPGTRSPRPPQPAPGCSGATCTVNLTGAQTIEIDPGIGIERDLRVGPIEPAAVTVSVSGDAARLTPGGAAELSDLRVELVSVADRDVSLRVDRS